MKREGRQHGMVRLTAVTARTMSRFQFPPTTGSFTKVSTKPSNHSKSTPPKYGRSKSSSCHHPDSTKSKHKGKGSQKIRHSDLTLNRRLISCRVVGHKGHHGFNYAGVSASDVLGRLSNYSLDSDYDDHDDVDDVEPAVYEYEYEYDGKIEDGVVLGVGGVEEEGDVVVVIDDDGDLMGFCDVGLLVEQGPDDDVEDDGWFLVGAN